MYLRYFRESGDSCFIIFTQRVRQSQNEMADIDLFLIFLLGFSGSFGHCASMCGPLVAAFSLSQSHKESKYWRWGFHGLLNLGRAGSYAIVGAALGALGSASIATGELAGIGSGLRQAIALLTGFLLIWMGLTRINPQWLPQFPVLHPILGKWHDLLGKGMTRLAGSTRWWTPLALGALWGLIPCGFLYAAQLKAIETGDALRGAATMLAFGLGTAPVLFGVGLWIDRLGRDRRGQLFRLGGWITVAIGLLTLLRTDSMADYTGHGALLLLVLALIARPVRPWIPWLLPYRRLLGVGSFILASAHTGRSLEHTFNWNPEAIAFMVTSHRYGAIAGIVALLLMVPAALTSFDRARQYLGSRWRSLHLLTVPGFVFATVHAIAIGSHYLGELSPTRIHWIRTAAMLLLAIGTLALRGLRPWHPKGSDS